MKKTINFILISFVLVLWGLSFSACSETEKASRYDNWQARNESFIDSLKNVYDEKTDPNLYAVVDEGNKSQLIFYKKEIQTNEGLIPEYNDSIVVYYHGTNILEERFDGNFDGKEVQINDKPTGFRLNKTISGWIWPLQHMREGERWKLFIPWQSGYGERGSGSILGYSTLIFTIQLEKVVKQ
ncbi:MAG: peptidylprolyl isomerase [Bacteroidales bacterium]|nr:peptidylprolyl isomerase [Bacteroidales bacterium]